MIVDPTEFDRRGRNALITGIVGPRPIAWVSSLAADGTANLAPFSFFNALSFDPPTVAIGPGSRQGVNKDSLRNLKATGEFALSVVSRELAERANASSGEFPPEVDEWEVAGVTREPCEVVAPPRVAESPAALECRVRQVVELADGDRASNCLVLARVVRIHIRDGAFEAGQVLPDALDLVGRMGGDEWSTTRDRFTLPRPATADPDEIARGLAEMDELAGLNSDRRR